jgi:hypothetical protein
MILRSRLLLAIALFILLLPSCAIGTRKPPLGEGVSNPVETFSEADRPGTEIIQASGLSFNLVLPWGYARAANATRNYPIVVNGCWGEGGLFSEAVRKRYPAFYLDFNNYSTDEHGALLANLLDVANADHRIDMNRVYLTGFSQGGSGSFKLVRGMLSKGKLFAAIIRVAGQSESVLAPKAVAKTSLWYHIGLVDEAVRVDVARDSYANLKADPSNSQAIESTKTDTITGFSRSTKTLTKDGIEVVKMSEYAGMGHTAGPCYSDPALFDWLFNQSLAIR